MSEVNAINLPLEEMRAYCKTQPIARLSLFGSALRNELTSDSDIDLLVEYEPDAPVGYFTMARHMRAFSEIVGRKVDLFTPKSLSRHIRAQVLEDARLVYAQAA